MDDASATRPSLLVRIRDPRDGAAWAQFLQVYAPLIYGFARKHGLQDADAADLAQEVLRAVAQGIRRLDYDRQRGAFRGWLFTVVRNELRTFLARRSRQAQGSGDTHVHDVLEAQPDSAEDPAGAWDRDYEQRLFAWAAAQVRGQVEAATWQAFWQTSVDGKKAREVARGLGMTVAAVYMAKSRVVARLKELLQHVDGPTGVSGGGNDG